MRTISEKLVVLTCCTGYPGDWPCDSNGQKNLSRNFDLRFEQPPTATGGNSFNLVSAISNRQPFAIGSTQGKKKVQKLEIFSDKRSQTFLILYLIVFWASLFSFVTLPYPIPAPCTCCFQTIPPLEEIQPSGLGSGAVPDGSPHGKNKEFP